MLGLVDLLQFLRAVIPRVAPARRGPASDPYPTALQDRGSLAHGLDHRDTSRVFGRGDDGLVPTGQPLGTGV
jgi:hypothetical protein